MGKEKLSEMIFYFLDNLEKEHKYVGLYASTYFYNTVISDEIKKRFDSWVADWRSVPLYEGNIGIWQKSNKGTQDGVKGYVDIDISYRNYADIIYFNNLNIADIIDITYVVKKNDSLWGISEKYLGSGKRYTEIKDYNGLKSNTIYPGQVLKIRR